MWLEHGLQVRAVRAVFLNGPRLGTIVNVPDTTESISVPTMIETCMHYVERHGVLDISETATYRKVDEFAGAEPYCHFETDTDFAKAYFCQQCYSEAKANLEAENLKASIRKEVIYELQSFLKEFE